jgi:SM-20-related protein
MMDQIIQDIQTKGFSFIENLLSDLKLKEINQFFAERKFEFSPASIGPKEKRLRDESIRGDHTFWIDPLSPPEVFKSHLDFLNELKTSLNERFYLGLKEFECHLAYYPPGSFYKKHSDRFDTSSSRSLSFVFYLNQEWQKDWCGELVLFDRDQVEITKIYPLPGSFICFLSEDFPHEVLSSTHERRSMTGWMHTKIIN